MMMIGDKLNNIDLSTYKAQVSKKIIHPAIQNNKFEWLKSSLTPVNLSSYSTFKNIEIKILFEGNNLNTINSNIAKFTAIMKDEFDFKFRNLNNNFHCYLVESTVEETDVSTMMYLNLNVQTYEYSNEVSTEINLIASKMNLTALGNLNTPCILEITPSQAMVDLIIEGVSDDPIIIKNLPINKKLIINGEDGIITVDGVNKFSDTTIWDFPRLKPGLNEITFSKSYLTGTIKYKARY